MQLLLLLVASDGDPAFNGMPGYMGRYSLFVIVRYIVSLNDVLAQDCSNSIANALELLQSCTKPSVLSLEIPVVLTMTIFENIIFHFPQVHLNW